MRLRVLTNLSGPDFKLAAGEITDRFDGADAEKLIAYRNAEPVPEEPAAPVEAAPSRTPRKPLT